MFDARDVGAVQEWGDPAANAHARAVMADYVAATEALVALDRERLSGKALSEITLATERARAQVDYAAAANATALHWSGFVQSHHGAASVAGWVTTQLKGKRSVPGRSAKLGRVMWRMPLVEAAWKAGSITTEHVSVLVRAASGRRRAAFAEDEARLVGYAITSSSFEVFVARVTRWSEQANPEEASAESQSDVDARKLCVEMTIGGVHIQGQLDPVGGLAFLTHLDELTQHERELDKSAIAAGVLSTRRTAEQLRADALSAMARRSARFTGATPVTPTAVINVHMDLETFEATVARASNAHSRLWLPEHGFCRTPSGHPISLDDAADLALFARIQTVITDPKRLRVDLGREQRFFVGAARKAIEARDGTCTFPGCTLPAMRCDIDHLHEWDHGGRTDQANGHAVCRYHHLRRHRGWATATRGPDTGVIDWTWHGPPDARSEDGLPDPAREPFRPPDEPAIERDGDDPPDRTPQGQ